MKKQLIKFLILALVMSLAPFGPFSVPEAAASCSEATTSFTYTGSDDTYNVPAGSVSISVKIWGAAGGGSHSYNGGWSYGGGGGYTAGDIEVSGGESLTVRVGGGGTAGNSSYNTKAGGTYGGGDGYAFGGGGGGYSGIFDGATPIVMAGGGGGAGAYNGNQGAAQGGEGGGTTGEDGASSENRSGKKGTQSAGGAHGTGGEWSGGSDGAYLSGGDANGSMTAGGGSGYYGGGAGGRDATLVGAGGGGSGYIGGSGVSGASMTTATNQTPANTGDSDYQAGVGVGGGSSVGGGPGLVVITNSCNPAPIASAGSSSANAITQPSGMDVWWTFDGYSHDLKSGQDLTLNGDATYGTAYVGENSMAFDGTGDYLTAADSSTFTMGTGDWTMMFWLKLSDTGSLQYLYNHGSDWTTGSVDALQVYYNGTGSGIQIDGVISNSGANFTALQGDSWDTNWHHVAIVRSGDDLKIYRDGVDATTSSNVQAGFSVPDWTSDVYIGKQNKAGSESYFSGSMDEFMYFGSALSASQVAAIAGAGSDGVNKNAKTANGSLDMDRLATEASSDFGLSFDISTGNPTSGLLQVTFPSGFTVDSAFTSGTCSGGGTIGSFTYDSTHLYGLKSGCSGTATLSGAAVTNPDTAGEYTIAWSNDSGEATVFITDDDAVSVYGNVDPTLTFDIDVSTGDTETAADYAIDFGQIDFAAPESSDNSGVDSIWLDFETNATAGGTITVRSANAAMVSTSTSDQWSSATASLAANTEAYGICVDTTIVGTPRSGHPGGTSWLAASPYDTSCTAGAAMAVGALQTSDQTVMTAAGPLDAGRVQVRVGMSVASSTPAHPDYQDVLTFTAVSTY